VNKVESAANNGDEYDNNKKSPRKWRYYFKERFFLQENILGSFEKEY